MKILNGSMLLLIKQRYNFTTEKWSLIFYIKKLRKSYLEILLSYYDDPNEAEDAMKLASDLINLVEKKLELE